MSTAVIERLQQERADIDASVQETLDAVEERDLSKSEMETVTRSRERIAEIDAQLRPLQEFMETRAAAQEFVRKIREPAKPQAGKVETRSLGEAFVSSEEFRSYHWSGRSGYFEARALPTDLTDIAALLPKPATVVDITPPVESPLLSFLRPVPVSQNAIETVVWAATGAAAVVPEGGTKPLIEFTPLVQTKTLDTIAGATQITRQMAEDAASVAAYINSLLVREVAKKAESEAAAALTGATISGVTAPTLLEGIRVAIGEVQAAGYSPDAVLLSPADWADLDVLVYSSTLGGPTVGSTFWGLRPLAANSQPAGTATVGDFGAAVQRYVRSGTSVYMTDSHEGTFLQNIFTILAETRQKTVVTRSGALREVTVAP